MSMRHTPIRLIILALAALAGQPVCGSFAQQSSDGGSPPVFGQQQAPAQQFFDSRDEVAVSVAPLSDAITPGSDFAIAVIFEMSPTWHIWTQPNGTPDGMAVFGGAINTEFSVDLPAGSPITLHTDQTL